MQCPRCRGETPTPSLCSPCQAALTQAVTGRFASTTTNFTDGFTGATATMPHAAGASGVGDAGPLSPGQAFGVRYHIIRLLGSGGMGAVYHGWDAALEV